MTDDEIEASGYHSALKEQHDEDPDSQYTEETSISVSRLMAVAATDEARNFVANIAWTVSTARETGAGMRRRNDAPEDTAPAPRGP